MPNRPSADVVFRQELSVEADILNSTNTAQKPWAVKTCQVNYAPGQQSYALNVTDFGRAYMVTRIVDGPYIKRVMVPFTDLNAQDYGTLWNYGLNQGGWAWALDVTPEKMSFFRTGPLNPTCQVTIEPQPQERALYEITYVPGVIGNDDPLQTAIQLPEHSTLVQLRVAKAVLPYSAWHEDENENRAKRIELAASFSDQLDRPINGKEAIFRKYISAMTMPKTVMLDDFATW
jgi:hypothetical protein